MSRKVHMAFEEGSMPREVAGALWAGQYNDPYWHGLFGGLYLPNLRFPVYRPLLTAEIAVEKAQGEESTDVETIDFDCDGEEELLVESWVMDLYFKPSLGGCLVGWSSKPGRVNILDVLSRREEASHRRLAEAIRLQKTGSVWDELLAKEMDLDKHLCFDCYRYASLLDHFFCKDTTLETVSLSESGFERLYQGSVLLPLWHMELGPRRSPDALWTVRINQSLSCQEP